MPDKKSESSFPVQMKERRRDIWDVHIHQYPESVIADPGGWGREKGERHWTELVTSGPQGWSTIDGLLKEMDRNGVERCVLQGWYWEKSETCLEQNRWYANWVKAHGDRLSAFASMHAEMEDIEGELERARDWGAIGVGELLPEVQVSEGWKHEGWAKMLNWTMAQGWPVLLHVTEAAGHFYPGRVATPLDGLVELFETYRDQKWILAHWGGGLPFYTLNARVKKALCNCYFDTAAGPLLYDERVWKTVVNLVGYEKILFGSDFPLKIKPAIQAEAEMSTFLRLLDQSNISKEAKTAIGSGNAKKLLGFPC